MLSVPEGQQVAFDISCNNELSMKIAKEHSMVFQMKAHRMYTKGEIPLDLDRVYAFSTLGASLL